MAKSFGENHYKWKGENASYIAKHTFIKRKKGDLNKCEHCGKTDKKKYEWANKNHKYSRNPKDYIRLCTSCHRKYDLLKLPPSLLKLSQKSGIKSTTLWYRIKRGVPLKLAISLPPKSGRYWKKLLNIKQLKKI